MKPEQNPRSPSDIAMSTMSAAGGVLSKSPRSGTPLTSVGPIIVMVARNAIIASGGKK